MVVLGRGGAGKSTLAARLGALTGLPVVELDAHFWRPGPTAMPHPAWAAVQQELTAARVWIMDGDLGPYDVLAPRLRAADTVIVLDFSLLRCAWRAVRRSREQIEFWRWVVAYRRVWRPRVLREVAEHAGGATVYVFRGQRAVDRWVVGIQGRKSG